MSYIYGLPVIIGFMTVLWIVSVIIRNASIVDPFWGIGFIILNSYYLITGGPLDIKKIVLFILVVIWGSRLSIHLWLRNAGKGEDFRYKKFRNDYGPERYWWVSFFQVFLLQGILIWLVSAPLHAVNSSSGSNLIGILEIVAMLIWITGFIFEAGGDYQLKRFRSDKANKGLLLTTGLWRYTRHPNYFGDAAVWWGFGLFGVAAGGYVNLLGSLLMTLLLIRISGVFLLERTLKETKPGYLEYSKRTSSFIPWFPKKG